MISETLCASRQSATAETSTVADRCGSCEPL
jgi:hypothetical protein